MLKLDSTRALGGQRQMDVNDCKSWKSCMLVDSSTFHNFQHKGSEGKVLYVIDDLAYV